VIALGLLAGLLTAPLGVDAFVPTAAIGVVNVPETLRLRLDGETYDETRTQLRPELSLGFEHPLPADAMGPFALDGHLSLGLGATWTSGAVQMPLRESLRATWSPASWLALRLGVGAGLVLDLDIAEHSHGEVFLPASVVVAEWFELAWLPAWVFPLESRTERVFGGERVDFTGPGVRLLAFELRFRITGLGFDP
jgi:hypothetical protein